MSIYEASITNPKKQLEFYKDLSEQLQQENKQLKEDVGKFVNDINELQKELNKENLECSKYVIENQKLKKQLEEEKKLKNKLLIYNADIMYHSKKFIKYLKDEIYNIEPKGTAINYNCEYDSEEDYVRAMQEQSKLNTLKEILQKYKEITGYKNE